jgi:protein O-GlcNAc transferase
MPPPRAGIAGRLRQRFQLAQVLHQDGRVADAALIYQEILRADPRHADALHYLGLVALQTGQAERGVRLIEQAVALKPNYAEALGNLGGGYAELGRPQDALAYYDKALAVRPDLAEVHDSRGNVLRELRRYDAAVASHDRAIALRPSDAGAFSNRGNALRDLHRYEAALASYDRAITLQPGFIEARSNRASLLQASGRYAEALSGFDEVIALVPGYAEAHNGRGNVLRDLRRPDKALASFVRAVALKQDYVEAHNNLGNVLQDLRQYDKALSSHRRAVELRPDFAEAHNNQGNALHALQRFEEAFVSYARAIALKPDYAEAHYNAGNNLAAMHRMTAALESYDRVIALRPQYADAHRARGLVLHGLKRYREALASYERAQALAADMDWLAGDIVSARAQICDWSPDETSLEERIWSGRRVTAPFTLTFAAESSVMQRKAAEVFTDSLYRDGPGRTLPAYVGHEKIRVGYFSADFRDHAMMHVMIDLFDCHDRSRFELTAFSFGPDSQGDWAKTVARSVDRFIDVRPLPDLDVVRLARGLEIDIAVDLMGYTMGARTGIFSHRAAPVQVAYLGFPATMGAGFIDYIIADDTLISAGEADHYSEKVVYLPGTYQVNSRHRAVSDRAFTRTEQGLPEAGFVFCCFNNNYKIAPSVFDIWMRILRRVDDSVLWLYAENADAVGNLRKEATARQVAPERLIFARKLPLGEHLVRHSMAGLFLDTLPYTGHATASLALWAGLPVLTRIGRTFAGRVAASLLKAIEMGELVTTTPEAYEALAVELATHPDKLGAIRTRLADNRLRTPLFDTARFARHLETAYQAMHVRAQAGLAPAAIDVAATEVADDGASLARSGNHS